MATMKEIYDGLAILMKYEPEGGVDASHDLFCAAPFTGRDDVSAEDQKTLDALGWHWDEDADSWARFT